MLAIYFSYYKIEVNNMNISKAGLPLIAFVVGSLASYVVLNMQGTSTSQAMVKEERKPLYWVAPMDASFRRDKPGKSPMGMELKPFYGAEDSQDPAGTVNISAQIENSLGVKATVVKRVDLQRNIQSAGFLQYDESSIQHYHVRVNGWLETLYVSSVGDKVKKGQKLFDLYSPELVYAQEEYLAAFMTKNQDLVKAALLKMRALGISAQQISNLEKSQKVLQTLTFYAVRDGYISSLNVRQGMYIQPQLEIMGTGDLKSIWVIAEVFERQANWLSVGLGVEMTLAAFPDKKWIGKVDYIFPALNSENRTVQARIVFFNPNLLLKPNMFAQLSIQAKAIKNSLVVPNAAVIHSADMQRVVLALGEGKFRSVKVLTGIESMGYTQILAGLDEGQHVVHSAQFLIDSESSINADLSRMQHEPAEMPEIQEMSGMTEPKEDSSRVWVLGKVTALMGEHQLKIQHQPIPEWEWPQMNMKLNIQKDISLDGIKNGDNLGFCLDKMPDGKYLITHIENQSAIAVNKNQVMTLNKNSVMSAKKKPAMDMGMEMNHD